MYSKLPLAWSRGVAAEHAALSRPRSRVRIPSGPLKEKMNLEMNIEPPGFHFTGRILRFYLLVYISSFNSAIYGKVRYRSA